MFTDEEITLDEEVFKALEVLKLLHSRLGKGVAYNDIRSIKTLCKNEKKLSDHLDNEIFDALEELQALRTRGKLFTRMTLPLVRRAFSASLAKDIVTVQPMTLPENLIFFVSSSATVPITKKKSQ